MKLTISSARKLALAAQGLSEPVSSALEAELFARFNQCDRIEF